MVGVENGANLISDDDSLECVGDTPGVEFWLPMSNVKQMSTKTKIKMKMPGSGDSSRKRDVLPCCDEDVLRLESLCSHHCLPDDDDDDDDDDGDDDDDDDDGDDDDDDNDDDDDDDYDDGDISATCWTYSGTTTTPPSCAPARLVELLYRTLKSKLSCNFLVPRSERRLI